MITHIIHGSDIKIELIKSLQKQLTIEGGILKFIFHAVDDRHLQAGKEIPFEDLFDACRRFRAAKRISDRDIVYTLTEHSNAQNFFASLDPSDMRNGFLHAGDWELYIDCDESLPIAFTVVNMLVGYFVFPSPDRVDDFLHISPIGCVNDFCHYKREVIFKLRTGDICVDCVESMKKNRWSDLRIDHAMRILSALAAEMRFNKKFKPRMEPSGIHIDMEGKNKLSLTDYDGLLIDLDPACLAFYLFFLRYKGDEGLYMTVFSNDWAKKAYKSIYGKLKPLMSDDEMDVPLNKLANRKHNIRSEYISRINNAFIQVLGDRLAKPYLILGEKSKPFNISIPLTKVLVTNFNHWMELPSAS